MKTRSWLVRAKVQRFSDAINLWELVDPPDSFSVTRLTSSDSLVRRMNWAKGEGYVVGFIVGSVVTFLIPTLYKLFSWF